MYDEHDSKMIFADLVSRDNAFEGYYDNLGKQAQRKILERYVQASIRSTRCA